MMDVRNDRVISFRYIMRNGKNEVLENTIDGLPTSYLHGSGGIQSCLQNQLTGLMAGDRKIITLLKSNGAVDDDYSFEVIIDEVRNALPEELVLGYPVLPATEKCEAGCYCYR